MIALQDFTPDSKAGSACFGPVYYNAKVFWGFQNYIHEILTRWNVPNLDGFVQRGRNQPTGIVAKGNIGDLGEISSLTHFFREMMTFTRFQTTAMKYCEKKSRITGAVIISQVFAFQYPSKNIEVQSVRLTLQTYWPNIIQSCANAKIQIHTWLSCPANLLTTFLVTASTTLSAKSAWATATRPLSLHISALTTGLPRDRRCSWESEEKCQNLAPPSLSKVTMVWEKGKCFFSHIFATCQNLH